MAKFATPVADNISDITKLQITNLISILMKSFKVLDDIFNILFRKNIG
jgi:hypothetical protein